MTIALLFSLGTWIVRIQSFLVKFACTKRLFDLTAHGRSDYQCPHWASVYQVLNIPIEDQTVYFFLLFGQDVYIFEESPEPIQDVIVDVY